MAVDRAVTTAFAVLVAGVLAIEAVVAGASRAPLTELSQISDEHAQAVSVAIEVRSRLSSLLSEAISSVERARAEGALAQGYQSLVGSAASLEPITDTPRERADVATLERALREAATIAQEIDRAIRSGDASGARAELRDLFAATATANDAAGSLVAFNAREVRDAAEHARRRLLWALGCGLALGALVVAAAFVLVRQTRAAIEQHARTLHGHSEAMGAFASRAAHELRTPLQTLALALGLVERDPSNSRALARARGGVTRLRETVDVILEFSRASAAVQPGGASEVAEVAHDVLADVHPAAGEGRVALDATVSPGLRAAIAPPHLRIVLSNLVANGVKYAGGGPDARVSVTARAVSSGVEVIVADNGPGIPADAVAHVFEPFYRASSSPGGFGIGLATVQQVVRAHGGDVAIESAVGRGTTVRVLLPAAAANDHPSSTGTNSVASPR